MSYAHLIIVLMLATLTACVSDPINPYGGGDRQKASMANAKLGLGYMMQGNNEQALAKMQKALELDEENASAHHYLAELYNRLDEPAKAEKHYLHAIEITPEETSALNNYAVFLCRQGRYEASQEHFHRILENPLFKSKAQTFENMGLCAEQSGNVKQAEEYFRKALRYNAKLSKALLHMAQISFDKQSFLSAYGFYQRFLEVGKQVPQSLWLGILLERRKGNKNAVASYSLLLRRKFSTSKEAELLQRLEQREASAK